MTPEPERELLALPGGPTMVCWRRSTRARRISLRIDPSRAEVIVTLPPKGGRRAGMRLLIGHADWVAARLASLPAAVGFTDGATIPVSGRPVVIRHRPEGRFGARLVADRLEVAGAPEFLARRVTECLRAHARRELCVMVGQVTARLGVTAKRVSIKDTRSRWGSCSASQGLSFSWRLILAPILVQEYVVAHEVAHLRAMNHGPEFWRIVAGLTPHRAAAEAWLATNGTALLRMG